MGQTSYTLSTLYNASSSYGMSSGLLAHFLESWKLRQRPRVGLKNATMLWPRRWQPPLTLNTSSNAVSIVYLLG